MASKRESPGGKRPAKRKAAAPATAPELENPIPELKPLGTLEVKTGNGGVAAREPMPSPTDSGAARRTAARRATPPKPAPAASDGGAVSHDQRRQLIAIEAYYRAERRGFASGYEDDDWLEAERIVDAQLSARQGITSVQ